eukprot:3479615-Rhodomonas_salina.3
MPGTEAYAVPGHPAQTWKMAVAACRSRSIETPSVPAYRNQAMVTQCPVLTGRNALLVQTVMKIWGWLLTFLGGLGRNQVTHRRGAST